MSASSVLLCRVHLGGGSPAWFGVNDVQRGARPLARIIAPQACIRWTRGDPDHDAAMRIGGEAPGRRAHSSTRHESHRKAGQTATSDRHASPPGNMGGPRNRLGGPAAAEPLTPLDAGSHRPASRGGHKRHSAMSELARRRHDHGLCVPLRASAVGARSTADARLLERRKREASWIMPRRRAPPLGQSFSAAWRSLRRAGQARSGLRAFGREGRARGPRARACPPSRCRRRSRVPTAEPSRAAVLSGACCSRSRRACSISVIWPVTKRSRAMSCRSSASVFGGRVDALRRTQRLQTPRRCAQVGLKLADAEAR